jgi:futalosine hydrolase
MRLLIVAATEMEIKPFLNHFAGDADTFGYLITGVGLVATAYALARHLQLNKYDFVLQVGVAGCYGRKLNLGDVVFVNSDQFGDLGAEDHADFLDIFELGLADRDKAPFAAGRLVASMDGTSLQIDLPGVKGLSVNTVSGNERTIALRTKKYGCEIESMEGAAFHYVCRQEGVPFAQVRAISNYVTPRDKSLWKMKEAIVNLNEWAILFVESVRYA